MRLLSLIPVLVAGLFAAAPPAQAQVATSAGCLAVNALGSQPITLGSSLSFGPFSPFDEGFANQGADGDTIRVSIGGRDMVVDVALIGAGTTTERLSPTNQFAAIAIGDSPNHPESASLTIQLTYVSGTSPRPQVFIGCTGSPNPGQPGVVTPPPPTPTPTPTPTPVTPTPPTSDETTLLSTDFAVAVAEASSQLGDGANDMPSLLTTPAPVTGPEPDVVDQLEDLAGQITRAAEEAFEFHRTDFESGLEDEVAELGLSEAQAEAFIAELSARLLTWVGERHVDEARSTAAATNRSDQGDPDEDLSTLVQGFSNIASGGLQSNINQIQRIARRYGLRPHQLTGLEDFVIGEIIDYAESPLGEFAGLIEQINTSTLDGEEAAIEQFGAALDGLQALPNSPMSSSALAPLVSRYNTLVTNSDGETSLDEGIGALRADHHNNTLSFALSTKGTALEIGDGRTAIWARGKLSFLSGGTSGSDGNAYDFQLGVVHRLGQRAEIGAFAGAFHSDLTSATSGAEYQTDATKLGVYGNLRSQSGLTFGLSAFVENGDTDWANAGETASFGYETLGASLSVSGSFALQDWAVAPSVAYSYSERRTDAYVTSASTAVGASELTTNALTAAVSATRSDEVQSARLERVDTRLRLAGTYYDRSHSVLTTIDQESSGLSLGAGVTLHTRGGATLALDATLSGIGQDTQALGLAGRYDLRF